MAYTLTYSLINNNTEYEVTGYTGEPVDVVIPSEYNGKPVTIIGGSVFEVCSSLTSVVIPDSIRSIGNGAFSFCSSLTNVVIGNSVTSIGNSAFEGCTTLNSVVIPETVTSIGSSAFENCTSLTDITLESETPPTLGGDSFSGVSTTATFSVPRNAVNTYKTTSDWSANANQIEANSGSNTDSPSQSMVTYKTIINEAIQGFNNIQDSLVDKFAGTDVFNNIYKIQKNGTQTLNAADPVTIVEKIRSIPVRSGNITATDTVVWGENVLLVSFNAQVAKGYYHKDVSTISGSRTIPIATDNDILAIASSDKINL